LGNVLIACEFSGAVREEFARLGHFAMSCDLLETTQPTSKNSAHHVGDVLEVLAKTNVSWDLMIAHPPCQYLTWAATSSWNKPGRAELREAALSFFMAMINANIPRICVENPVGYPNTVFRKPDQIINPYQFGHPERKRTCLWLKNLPKLIPTNIVEPEQPTFIDSTTGKKRYFTDKMFPSKDRWKLRSLTFPGIAQAFAQQYSPLLPK
jgi:hypothetical protein